jgi:hypothetical protein
VSGDGVPLQRSVANNAQRQFQSSVGAISAVQTCNLLRLGVDVDQCRKILPSPQFYMCALITIAMQLTCVVDKEIHCTDNAYLAQLLNVPSCERVFCHQDRADVSSTQQRFVAPEQLRR